MQNEEENKMKEVIQSHAIRLALLEQSTTAIKDELHTLNGHVSKLIWVVVAAVISSIIQFILKGGWSV